MAKSKAVAVMKAAEKARRAEQHVSNVRRELVKAERAQARADEIYLALVRDSLPAGFPCPLGPQEGAAGAAT